MPLINTKAFKPPPTLKQTVERMHKMKAADLAKFIEKVEIVQELGAILDAEIKKGGMSESRPVFRITKQELRSLIIETIKRGN